MVAVLAALVSAEDDVVVEGEGEEEMRRASLRTPFVPFVPLAPWVDSLEVTTGSAPMREKTDPDMALPLVINNGR